MYCCRCCDKVYRQCLSRLNQVKQNPRNLKLKEALVPPDAASLSYLQEHSNHEETNIYKIVDCLILSDQVRKKDGNALTVFYHYRWCSNKDFRWRSLGLIVLYTVTNELYL